MKKIKRDSFKRSISAVILLAFLFLNAPCYGKVVLIDGQVTGDYTENTQGATTTLTVTSDKLIANCSSFNIPAGDTFNVLFTNPVSTSSALFRDVSGNMSIISGVWYSNVQNILINSSGIRVDPGAQITVPNLILSSLNISNSDFLAGRYTFEGQGGSVINQGYIRSPGGYAVLLGSHVENKGVIEAELGTVALAAGEKIVLNMDPQGTISVVVDKALAKNLEGNADAVKNSGKLAAGKVILTAKVLNDVFDNAINNEGIVQATNIKIDAQGNVRLVVDESSTGYFSSLQNAIDSIGNVTGGRARIYVKKGEYDFVNLTKDIDVITIGDTVIKGDFYQSAGTFTADPLLYNFSVGGNFVPGPGFYRYVHGSYGIMDILGLQAMQFHLGENCFLLNDIDASATVGWNVGAGFAPITNFAGNFDGKGYAIQNLYINRPLSTYVGLFSNIKSSASVQNVTLKDVNIIGRYGVGAVAGWNEGSITNCHASGNVAGVGEGTVFWAAGGVRGDLGAHSGGLVGVNYETGNISYSSADVKVVNNLAGYASSYGNTLGGLVAINAGGSIRHSWSTGDVIGNDNGGRFDANRVGGLVGSNWDGVIDDCHATGNVVGTNRTGGLVGGNDWGDITNSYATGNVTGTDMVGGLAGSNDSGTISGSHSSSVVIGKAAVGGLVGWNDSGITNCYSDGNVTALGGEVVSLNNGRGSWGTATCGGGLVGVNNNNGTIAGSYSNAAVNGHNAIGGLAGANCGAITDSYATGNINGNTTVWDSPNSMGGMVGWNLGSINRSYSTGNVSGHNTLGGFVGINSDTISNSYSLGNVTGNNTMGGFAGCSYAGTFNNNYWYNTTNTTGIGSGAGSVTKASGISDFSNPSYPLYAGWDFNNMWKIGANGYPVLIWQPVTPSSKAAITTIDINEIVSLQIASTELVRNGQNYLECIGKYRTVSFDVTTPHFYFYHSLTSTDQSAFDSIKLDESAYDFIANSLEMKRKVPQYYMVK